MPPNTTWRVHKHPYLEETINGQLYRDITPCSTQPEHYYSVKDIERSHRALADALEELYVKKNILELDILRTFRDCMDLREEADYGHIYSEESAKEVVENARTFLNRVREILKKTPT